MIEEAGLSIEMQDSQVPVEGVRDISLTPAGEDKEEALDPMAQQVVALKARLQEAVALEEYEEAARLRDEIGRLEHSIEK